MPAETAIKSFETGQFSRVGRERANKHLFYFGLNHKYFGILTFSAMVSNVIRVESHSSILQNRHQIHEIKYFSNIVIEKIKSRD